MAGDEEIPVRDDVPTTGAIVKTASDASALARRIAGETPPDEMRFACVMCGWDKTLKFEEDEMLALGGDVTNYSGPCPDCGSMTLVPRNRLIGDDFKPAAQRAKEARREEFEEQADVFIDKVKSEVVGVMAGSTLSPSPEERPASPSAPRDDLPEVDDIDMSDLKPRGS